MEDLIKNKIDIAITYQCPLEIVYSKDGNEQKIYYLRSVKYSYGGKCITADIKRADINNDNTYTISLSFRIDKILYADIKWMNVFPQNSSIPQDGLYIIACRGDMHIVYEVRQYEKSGDNILGHYSTDESNEYFSGHDILAYHYIPFYNGHENKIWYPLNKDVTILDDLHEGIYTYAYILKDETKNACIYCDAYDTPWDGEQIFPSVYKLMNTKHDGIKYTSLFSHSKIIDIGFDNIVILAYNYCPIFTEYEDHLIYLDKAKEFN